MNSRLNIYIITILVKTKTLNKYKRAGFVIFNTNRFEFIRNWFNTPGCKDELVCIT